MTAINPHAIAIAEAVTSCAIPSHSSLHQAMRRAQIEQEAMVIERLAAVAGFSLEKTACRLVDGAAAAGAFMSSARLTATESPDI